MEQSKHGIQETLDIVKLGLSLGGAIQKSLEDKEITFSDAAYLIDVAKNAPAAINGIGQVPNEVADMSPEEKAELMKLASEQFDLPNDKAEAIVEQSLSTGLELAKLVAVIMKKD